MNHGADLSCPLLASLGTSAYKVPRLKKKSPRNVPSIVEQTIGNI